MDQADQLKMNSGESASSSMAQPAAPLRQRPSLSTRTAVALSFSAMMLALIVLLYVMHLTRDMPRDGNQSLIRSDDDDVAARENTNTSGNAAHDELITALHLLRVRMSALEEESASLRKRIDELEAQTTEGTGGDGDGESGERARVDRLLQLHRALRGPDVTREEAEVEYERLRAMDAIALESAAAQLIDEAELALAAEQRASAASRCERLMLLVRGHAIATDREHAELRTRVDQLLMRLADE